MPDAGSTQRNKIRNIHTSLKNRNTELNSDKRGRAGGRFAAEVGRGSRYRLIAAAVMRHAGRVYFAPTVGRSNAGLLVNYAPTSDHLCVIIHNRESILDDEFL